MLYLNRWGPLRASSRAWHPVATLPEYSPMSELLRSILALLLRLAGERLERGGQFLTLSTLRDEISHIVAAWLHSPQFIVECERYLVARFRADKEANSDGQ